MIPSHNPQKQLSGVPILICVVGLWLGVWEVHAQPSLEMGVAPEPARIGQDVIYTLIFQQPAGTSISPVIFFSGAPESVNGSLLTDFDAKFPPGELRGGGR